MSTKLTLAEHETRTLPAAELRIAGPDSAPTIIGYAAVFNTWADIGGWFRESIRPGAFAKTILEADIRALVNHDPSLVLARNKSGTLALHEDAKGLVATIDPVPTTWAKDLLVSMKRGDVSGMSFGFEPVKQDVDYAKSTRELLEVKLFDVSVVTFPAYPQTSASVRAGFARPSPWDDFDALIAKIKAGASLTLAERRTLVKYVPELAASPASTGWRALLDSVRRGTS